MSQNFLAAYQEKPEKVHFESQEDGEEIVMLLRQHWVTNVGWLSLLFVMFVAPALLFSGFPLWEMLGEQLTLILVIVWYLFVLAFGLESFLHWYFNVYIITDRRIVDVDFHGLLHKEISETSLDQIQDVTYRVYGLAATVFDYGDVLIQTAAEQARFDFLNVARPGTVHDKITDLAQHE